MREACLSVSPEIGITFGDDVDDVQIDLSLYLRHYVYNCFNTKDLPIGKFSHNYIGAQISVAFRHSQNSNRNKVLPRTAAIQHESGRNSAQISRQFVLNYKLIQHELQEDSSLYPLPLK